MVERIAQGILDDPLGLDGRQLVLGLADEFRFADEDRQHADRGDHHVVGGDRGGALVAGEFGIGLQPLGQRDAQARFMGAAVRRRDGVAVGADRRISAIPGDRPFQRAVAAGTLGLAGEDVAVDAMFLAERGLQIVLEAAGEVKHGLFRGIGAFDQRSRADPADLDAAEQIGLGAGHAVEPSRVKPGAGAEDVRIGMEADLGAAAVVNVAELLEAALRNAAGKALTIEFLVARDLDHQII